MDGKFVYNIYHWHHVHEYFQRAYEKYLECGYGDYTKDVEVIISQLEKDTGFLRGVNVERIKKLYI